MLAESKADIDVSDAFAVLKATSQAVHPRLFHLSTVQRSISLFLPELAARIGFGVLLIVNGAIFWKAVLPKYIAAFNQFN